MRRRISTTERLAIFTAAKGICHICGAPIDPLYERYEIEHVIPLAMGGDEDRGSTNLQPAHASCHGAKTMLDVTAIAKAKRLEARHNGALRKRAIIPGSRGTPFKKRIDGTVVRRNE